MSDFSVFFGQAKSGGIMGGAYPAYHSRRFATSVRIGALRFFLMSFDIRVKTSNCIACVRGVFWICVQLDFVHCADRQRRRPSAHADLRRRPKFRGFRRNIRSSATYITAKSVAMFLSCPSILTTMRNPMDHCFAGLSADLWHLGLDKVELT